jgi:hypothetical protein
MKKCFKCGLVKPISEFYKNSCHKDEHQSNCKSCELTRFKSYYHSGQGKIYHKKYQQTEQGKKVHRKACNKYQKTPKGKKIHITNAKLYREKHPEKIKAYNFIAKIIKKNLLSLPNKYVCKFCHIRIAQEYHHPDYSKPFKVIPLCKICHTYIHSIKFG